VGKPGATGGGGKWGLDGKESFALGGRNRPGEGGEKPGEEGSHNS